jgi:hypothetical protein
LGGSEPVSSGAEAGTNHRVGAGARLAQATRNPQKNVSRSFIAFYKAVEFYFVLVSLSANPTLQQLDRFTAFKKNIFVLLRTLFHF